MNKNNFTQATCTKKGGNTLLIDLLKETSCLPSYAKRYLKVIIETQHDLVLFIEHYLNRYKNIMISIAEFRSDKMESRTFTIDDFQKEFEMNRTRAIEKLFLYPHSRIVERTLIIPKGKSIIKFNISW
jgi:hypothetical protein